MEESFREKVRQHEKVLESLSLTTSTFAARRDKLVDECQIHLISHTVQALESFLELSQTLRDVYGVLLGHWWQPRLSGPSARAIMQGKSNRIDENTKAVQESLTKMGLVTRGAFTSLEELGFELNEFYTSKILPLAAKVKTTQQDLECSLSSVGEHLKDAKSEEAELQRRVQQLESETGHLKSVRNKKDKYAKDAAESSFWSFTTALICLVLSPTCPPLLLLGIILLGYSVTQSGLSFFTSKQRALLEKEMEVIGEEIVVKNKSIESIQTQIFELEITRNDLHALATRGVSIKCEAEKLCKSSRETEKLFRADTEASTTKLFEMSKVSDISQTMKFKSTQQEILKLIKTVAHSITTSAVHKQLLLKATRPERSTLQRLSSRLESSLKEVEIKCPAVMMLLHDDFDEKLHQEIRDIDGCGMQEPLFDFLVGWSFYLIKQATLATCEVLLERRSLFVYVAVGFLLSGALYLRALIEQAVVVGFVLVIWLKLSLLEIHQED